MDREKVFKPFPEILIPVLEGHFPASAAILARQIQGKTSLVGFIEVPAEKPLSSGNAPARKLRMWMNEMKHANKLECDILVSVSYNRVSDFFHLVNEHKPDLLILQWPDFIEKMQISSATLANGLGCDVALVSSDWPEKITRTLVPLRGGQNAQLSLRLAMALPAHETTALNIVSDKLGPSYDTEPFRGLARILPSLSEVDFKREISDEPLQVITTYAQNSDALIIGAPPFIEENQLSLGAIADALFQQCRRPIAVVKSKRRAPTAYTGVEGERSGIGAISILVDKWFADNTFHANEFDNIKMLIEKKKEQNVTISLALPALNEEETVGKVIKTIKTALLEKYPLLDEIVLIDSNSTDRTREIAQEIGIPVYIHQQILPQYEARSGKGEALWKSLLVTRGDILIWIDSDIVNIHPRFVYGVLGPLLMNERIQFVKGFYQRPLKTGRRVQSTGGGRVTELTARPLINLFYPELSGIIQPLSGEYGGRRKALEQLTFYSGYGVETGMLIDVFEKFGIRAIAQVDLLERIHHNQPLQALSKMSFLIMQTVLRKLENRFGRAILEEVNKTMKIIQYQNGAYYLDVQELPEYERPPMITVKEYLDKFYPEFGEEIVTVRKEESV